MDPDAQLRAGGALFDITPKAGTHLGGTWGTLRGAEVVAEPLYARALVFELAGRKLCIVAPDLEIITRDYTERIRQAAQEKCGLEPDAVMVHLPQPHSTPPLGNFIIDDEFEGVPPELEYLRGSQSEYCEFAVEKIVDSIVEADRALRPVKIAAGSAVRADLAFNRRGITREGRACMPWLFSSRDKPLGPTDIRYLEGPTDPEVGVFCARDDDLQMVAMLLHYTCHPVNVFALHKHVVSPDWPGAWAEGMQRGYGNECVPLVLNGCCGNINPWPAFRPNFVPDHRRMGKELAETAEKVIHTLSFERADTLDWRVRHVSLPLKKASPEARAEAEALLKEHPEPIWPEDSPDRVDGDWMEAAMLMSVELERERSPDYDCEIQVFRVGDMALVGLPGEPFVEGQLAIKIGSPAYPTYVAHDTTDFAGYIVPSHSYPHGGHEIRDRPAKWAKLEPGALETIVENTVDLLEEMF